MLQYCISFLPQFPNPLIRLNIRRQSVRVTGVISHDHSNCSVAEPLFEPDYFGS